MPNGELGPAKPQGSSGLWARMGAGARAVLPSQVPGGRTDSIVTASLRLGHMESTSTWGLPTKYLPPDNDVAKREGGHKLGDPDWAAAFSKSS